jgi:preprotein translocase subunit SecE
MAKKQVETSKTSKVIEILRKEYPFEQILLGILGLLVIVLGVYLIEGVRFQITLTSWWIFNTATKRLLFSIFIVVLGTVSFFMAVWPFIVPSIAEMKKVTWPGQKAILNHVARVFGFIIFISLFFVLFDIPLRKFFEWLAQISA